VGNPLITFLRRLLTDEQARLRREETPPLPDMSGHQSSGSVLLVLRRMRIPLIALIAIFALSVLGMSLVPGVDDQGRPHRLSLFESFYFMAYTATTIGFGEIPYAFTPAQRMWVTFAIFLSVVGWAYAVGSLLSLIQDKAFRHALARRRFARQVAKMNEPFWVLVGYGAAATRVARFLDDMNRRFVVVDDDEVRVAAVALAAYYADTPALLADATRTDRMVSAGLGYRHCEGVLALTGDDSINLDVAMTTAMLRPDLRVIAQLRSRSIADRLSAFGTPEIVNPTDRFGDHLRILIRSPAAYQLMMWLTSAPGTPLPHRHAPLPHGRWVVCGSGRLGRELTADLRGEGLTVTMAPAGGPGDSPDENVEPAALAAADIAHASAVVAATDSDTTNLWLADQAREANADVFVVAIQHQADNAALYDAVGVDARILPSEVVAHEVLARIANPALMDFLPLVPHQEDGWSARMVQRLVDRCGTSTPELWRVELTEADAPALIDWLAAGGLRLGDVLRSPNHRDVALDVVPLILLRDGDRMLAPDDDCVLEIGDVLLLAGRPAALTALAATVSDEGIAAYVIANETVPSGWLWRRLSQQGAQRTVDEGVPRR
jgi:voltage-gated potassium channel